MAHAGYGGATLAPVSGESAGLEDGRSVPESTNIASHPNPTAGMTTIEYLTTESGHTRLSIIDLRGVTLATLIDDDVAPGRNSVRFDASALPSGRYFILLETPSTRGMKVMQVER
jgi:hypothetical protein